MPQREFANQKALVAYAEQNGLAYEYEYTPAFDKRQRLLSPEQYEIVAARTSRGVSRAMLFSKAIIQAEWEANAPLREALAIKRERLRAQRAKRAATAVMRTQRGLDGLVPQRAGDLAGLERASCVVAHVSLCGDVHKQCEK
jgi:hypothetical protein